MKRAKRFAARRARATGIGKNGHPNDDYYARELVQDALADTTLGVLQWDPNARSLEQHVLDVIRLRSRRDRAHARRFPHEPIDALASDESVTMAEVDASLLSHAADTSHEAAALAAEVMATLRKLATGDPPVLRLLDALGRGAVSKVDAMRVGKLSSATYHNARRRLGRLIAQLSMNIQLRRPKGN